jgi:hypothetical protein
MKPGSASIENRRGPRFFWAPVFLTTSFIFIAINVHPSEVLFQGEAIPVPLPVCDHYASEKLMRKSLALQQSSGPCSTSPSTARTAPPSARTRARQLCAQLINSADNATTAWACASTIPARQLARGRGHPGAPPAPAGLVIRR